MKSSTLLFYKIYRNFYGKLLTTNQIVRKNYISFLEPIFGSPPRFEKNINRSSQFYIEKLELIPRVKREKILLLSKKYGIAYRELIAFKRTLRSTTRVEPNIATSLVELSVYIETSFWKEIGEYIKVNS